MPQRWVHPRIRGEYHLCNIGGLHGIGSPPHTRGIPLVSKARLRPPWFTPAYAGNTRQAADREGAYQVHPRIRGEYFEWIIIVKMRQGSPPHTRGILPGDYITKQVTRFTPAYAGNTIRPLLCSRRSWVHPRIRGEYFQPAVRSSLSPGSPPHTRGILGKRKFYSLKERFTPAYAGNTAHRTHTAVNL